MCLRSCSSPEVKSAVFGRTERYNHVSLYFCFGVSSAVPRLFEGNRMFEILALSSVLMR